MPSGMRLMISVMRDEASFILEWISYHRAIGFTDFLIYSNDCADGTDAILDRLMELGIVTHVPNPRSGKKTVQWQALSRARNHPLTEQSDWIMVADVDEFLVIHPGEGRLDDLFDHLPEANGFAVPWRMFGNSGQRRFEPGLVIERFTHTTPDQMVWPLRVGQFKSLFRQDARFARLGVHRPQTEKRQPFPPNWLDGSGREVSMARKSFMFTREKKFDVAQLNHYSLGSCEDFLVKMTRGRPNHMEMPIDLGYWVERNFNDVEDLRILRHRDAVQAGIDEFLEDGELAKLHEQGIAWRRERIAGLLRDHDLFLLFSRLVQSQNTPVLPMPLQMELVRMREQALPKKSS